ncbi:hypothetical protein K469DRAFT_360802 [Zopfia rhizophila CBS 207.26]|uniref:Uncharacterized protein n=1 Tax=Zopfia rhizophila CBS 207.26 TaxID=1314779 RepID=A0A6A6EI25_9PEZI|nr:hypothetical protein K469DRAFT_360802 [Zopfia rhizophila CBS 207.26]
MQSPTLGLGANRLKVEIGDRFSGGKMLLITRYVLRGIRLSAQFKVLRIGLMFTSIASPAAKKGDVSGRYLSRNPASEEHYVTMRDWTKACSAHLKCNQTVSGSASIDAHQSPLPTRCIEISKGGKRLYLRNTEGLHGAYITLTHRWNLEIEKFKTTANYEERFARKWVRGDSKALSRCVHCCRKAGRSICLDRLHMHHTAPGRRSGLAKRGAEDGVVLPIFLSSPSRARKQI